LIILSIKRIASALIDISVIELNMLFGNRKLLRVVSYYKYKTIIIIDITIDRDFFLQSVKFLKG